MARAKQALKPKTPEQITRELRRVERALKRGDLPMAARDELLGSEQALAWALGENVFPPCKCALGSLGAPAAEARHA